MEIKIHIWKSVFSVPEKFGFFRYCTRKVLEGFGGPRVGPTYPGGVHMDRGGGTLAHMG